MIEQLQEITTWLLHQSEFAGKGNVKPGQLIGYRALFNGANTADKLATAQMLGNKFNKKVYRVDLSQLVSKYLGETEKALAAVFKNAEGKDWILFFDEAEALFGKRTKVHDAHDRFANQVIKYLLHKMDNYPGLAIFATHTKGTIDEPFLRRFQTVLHFP